MGSEDGSGERDEHGRGDTGRGAHVGSDGTHLGNEQREEEETENRRGQEVRRLGRHLGDVAGDEVHEGASEHDDSAGRRGEPAGQPELARVVARTRTEASQEVREHHR